ncbi:phage antirepressor KilAC domain-containing protein [Mumia sp. DW29H23]|uniref:BRO-N domain-containing protein n=1 Tax=Mumia sp. DW29H23 TaxID=3421241 RepID=UPI003D695EB2
MTALDLFRYDEHQVRVVVRDGDPWFVLADVCSVLDLTNPTMVAGRLRVDDLSTAEVIDSMGRTQTARIVSESGLYAVIFQSRKPEALAFQDWVTHDVIPAIRRTGSYGAPVGISFEEMTAQVIAGLQDRIAAAQERAKALEAPAAAWNGLAAADGDFTVSDAAKVLARGGIETGPRKLYAWLDDHGWIFRRGGRWQAKQTAVNAGLLVERVTSGYFDEHTGERKQADPQVRVTPKGLERLRELIGGQGLAVIDGEAS